MGFFTKSRSKSKKKLPKGRVEEWSREDVVQWLAQLGMERYSDRFKAIAGKRLVVLCAADLYQLVDTKLDADLLLDAIAELRSGPGGTPDAAATNSRLLMSSTSILSTDSPNPRSTGFSPFGPPPRSIGSSPAAPASASAASQGAPSRTSSAAVTPSAADAAAASAGGPFNSASKAKARGAAENAEILSNWAGGTDVVKELFAFLGGMGIEGAGLVEATERSPIVGHIIGALWELHEVCQHARGNRPNCLQLDAYAQDILRVFDAEGKRLAFIDGLALAKLLDLIQEATDVADSYVRPGWLVRLAAAERSVEDFVRVHNAILDLLRAERVDTLPTGRALAYGSYHDASRTLRRMLKQVGSGSLEAGVRGLRTDEKARSEVATLLACDPQALLQEVEDSRLALNAEHLVDCEADPTPVREREYQTLFQQYDKNKSGGLELDELRCLLSELGFLDSVKPAEHDSYVLQQFDVADANGDGRVGFEEFCSWYAAATTSKARQDLRSTLGPQAEKDMKKVFCSFASFGQRAALDEMDGAKWSKLCRDCKLLAKNFSAIDADIVFAKVKTKGQRKIGFGQFLNALGALAEQRGLALEDVARAVLAAGGPTVSGTKAEFNRFHDDKSSYTGVYARGGPTNIEPSKDLSALLDRTAADVRGIKLERGAGGKFGQGQNEPPNLTPPMSARGPAPPRLTPSSLTPGGHAPLGNVTGVGGASGSMTARGPSPKPSVKAVPGAGGESSAHREELAAVFRQYASFGAGSAAATPRPNGRGVELDGARFAKLCRETGLLGGRLTPTGVDIIFQKAKAKGARKIAFAEFEAALQLVAAEKGVATEVVRSKVAAAGGPQRNATTPEYVKFHDDKSTYTGVYANGGPSTVDPKITLQSLTDRTNTATPQQGTRRKSLSGAR